MTKEKIREIEQKGITLIALIVTIIILLILAGVAINLFVEENGIFKRAIKAQEKQLMSQYEEELNLICFETLTDWNTTNKGEEDNMRNDIDNKVKEKNWVKETVALSNTVNEKTIDYLSVTSKEGYEFLLEIDSENKTVQVIWKDTKVATSVALTYNPNGGDGEEKTQSIRQGFSVALQECEYTKAGYKFVGWCEDANGNGEKYLTNKIFGPLSEDVTLYAIWSQNTATITFNSNGGSGTMTTQTLEKGADTQLSNNNSITRTGYKFLGWTDEEGSSEVKYTDGATINIIEDLTLYAVWERLMVVSYNGNSATSGNMSVDYVESGKSITLKTNAYTRTGYNFNGWNTNSNGTGTSYNNGTTISNVTADITLYAQWEVQAPEVSGPPSTTHTAGSLDTKYPGITWETMVKIAKGISNSPSVSSTTTQEVTVTVDGTNYTVGVGDTKSIVYNGATYTTRILGFNHDTLTTSSESSTGKAGISFEFVECITTAKMNNSNTNTGGWASSEMYKTLGAGGSGGIYANLISSNSGLIMKQVVKKYIPTYDTASTSNSNDYIWLLACSEIWDSYMAYAKTSEGSQYKYYLNIDPYINADCSSLLKVYSGSTKIWWLRSTSKERNDKFCYVVINGTCFYWSATNVMGVSPGFSI